MILIASEKELLKVKGCSFELIDLKALRFWSDIHKKERLCDFSCPTDLMCLWKGIDEFQNIIGWCSKVDGFGICMELT